MPNTTKTQIPDEINNYYDRTLLERAVANFVHVQWGQVRDIPRNSGTVTIKFRRYANLTAATTALTEGVTPTGSSLSVTDITATALQYGDYVTVTDLVDFSSQDAVLTETTQIQGDQAGDTIDQLARDVMVAGTSVSYGGVATTRGTVAATNVITTTLLRAAIRTLKTNKAKFLKKMVPASTNISTGPVADAYIAIVHPAITTTLKAMTGWRPYEEYGVAGMRLPGEVGKYEDIRFVETPNAKIFTGAGAGGIDVYAIMILGEQAYGITRVGGEGMKTIRKPFGTVGADPLDQRSTVGWKMTFVAKILNDAFMTRIEVASV